jgi:ligand-binding sensor domain-containing protein
MVATYKGIVKFDGTSFTYFTVKDGLVNNDVNTITKDASGNLWIGTEKGASQYDGRSFTNFFYNNDAINTVNCISRTVKAICGLVLRQVFLNINQHGFTQLKNISGSLTTNVFCICEDKSGNLWFGTEKGVFKHHGGFAILLTQKEGLISNEVVSLH